MFSKKHFIAAASFTTTSMLLAPLALAVQVFTEDISIEDTTPAVIFNDTTVLDAQYEWYIRGRDEFFAIVDVPAGQNVFGVTPGENRIALGYGSSTSGNDSLALGNSADALNQWSVAVGTSSSATGFISTAVGWATDATGRGSVALGESADAADSYGAALGAYSTAAASSSTAVGTSAGVVADAEASVALGAVARATEPWTIILGSDPSLNNRDEYHEVGVGTSVPLAPMHIFRDDGTAQVLVEETSTDAVPRTLFRLASAGSNAKFEIDNTMAGVNWAFTNSGNDFRISRQGSGVVEFRVDNAGNAFVHNDLEVGGNLTTNLNMPSDRNLKQNVEAVNSETILDKVAALPVTAWEYSDRPGERHLGPMAQDFHAAFGLGSGDTAISVVDASGVALASIKALNEKLEARNRELEERLALVEAMLTQLLPQTAQN